jgi:hypothetical protein
VREDGEGLLELAIQVGLLRWWNYTGKGCVEVNMLCGLPSIQKWANDDRLRGDTPSWVMQ